jgi:hypothetical protein
MGQGFCFWTGSLSDPLAFSRNSHAVDSYYRHSRCLSEACALIRAGLEKQNATT